MPDQRAGDADERQCGLYIKNNKEREKGTNSKRGKLMKREIPLTFANSRVQSDMDTWNDNLTRAKMFIDTEGRMPDQRAGDADERQCGQWIMNNRKREKGTNSECGKLMKREIPLCRVRILHPYPYKSTTFGGFDLKQLLEFLDFLFRLDLKPTEMSIF
jgi:hypothetical protein